MQPAARTSLGRLPAEVEQSRLEMLIDFHESQYRREGLLHTSDICKERRSQKEEAAFC